MEKKKYFKPEMHTLKINPSEMCAGSVCNVVDLKILEGSRKDITNVIPENGDGGSWDDKF